MSLYRDHGIVLRTYKLGEADRIVVLMTRARQGAGRRQGRAQDEEPVRRPPRAAHPRRPPALRGPRARHRHPGRAVDHFRAVRDDLDRLAASPLLEVVDQVAQEQEAHPSCTRCSWARCGRWAAGRRRSSSPAFFWKLLGPGGRPTRARALRCAGTDRPRRVRRRSRGGVLCRRAGGASRSALGAHLDASYPRRAFGGCARRPSVVDHARSRLLATRLDGAPPRAPHPLDDRPRPRLTRACYRLQRYARKFGRF